MKNKYPLPPITEAERTPLVEALLLIIEQQAQAIQKLEEDAQHLRDEVAVLKGEKNVLNLRPVSWIRKLIQMMAMKVMEMIKNQRNVLVPANGKRPKHLQSIMKK